DALRRKILDSAKPIDKADYYGCTPEQPANTPTARPTVQITSASVCEYWQGSLIAGSSVPNDKVSTLASQVFVPSRPTAGGPGPGCQDPSPRTYVVILRGGDKTWPVTIPYSVCIQLWPPALPLLRLGPHMQFQPADMFDPVRRITRLAR
ncbi:MAG: hypothetical protein HOV67_00455, partial [Kribbellaceae bacterium]|nr:hypothetical protein [Kribbellaceae bacterium]